MTKLISLYGCGGVTNVCSCSVPVRNSFKERKFLELVPFLRKGTGTSSISKELGTELKIYPIESVSFEVPFKKKYFTLESTFSHMPSGFHSKNIMAPL